METPWAPLAASEASLTLPEASLALLTPLLVPSRLSELTGPTRHLKLHGPWALQGSASNSQTLPPNGWPGI